MRESSDIIQESSEKSTIESNFENEKYEENLRKINDEKENSKEEAVGKVEQLKQKLENDNEKENKIPKGRKVICTGKTDKNDNISVVYNKNQGKKIIINNKEYKVKETFFMKDGGSMILETEIGNLTIKRGMRSKKIEGLKLRKREEGGTKEIYKIELSNHYDEQYEEFRMTGEKFKNKTKIKVDKKPFGKRIKDFFNNIFVNKTKQAD